EGGGEVPVRRPDVAHRRPRQVLQRRRGPYEPIEQRLARRPPGIVVGPAVDAHAVPGPGGGADERRMPRCPLAEEEERRLRPVGVEEAEERGEVVAGPVVEREVEPRRAVGVAPRAAHDDAGEERRREAGEVVEEREDGRKGEWEKGGRKLHRSPSRPFSLSSPRHPPPLPLVMPQRAGGGEDDDVG